MLHLPRPRDLLLALLDELVLRLLNGCGRRR
jgi:hypothetical protein